MLKLNYSQWKNTCLLLFLFTSNCYYIFIFSILNFVTAQVTPDKTLNDATVVERNGPVSLIKGGSQLGGNLFHSFILFNIPNNELAQFDNNQSTINILARVTGGYSSRIDGLIRANGTANLFLINPHGIFFGPNSQLDIGGSFLATTADNIEFNDGYIYSASQKNPAPLLSIRNPIGINFLVNPKNIINQSTEGLSVQPNRTIGLIGGPVTLKGGALKSPDGRIEIASIDSNNKALFSQPPLAPYNLIFDYDNTLGFQDISISKLALVDTSGEKGGDIQIFGRNIKLSEGGRIQSITSGSKNGGTILVNASESLSVLGNINLNSQIDDRFTRFGIIIPQKTTILSSTSGNGRSSDIKIAAKNLTITDGADITTATDGLGAAGDISINTPISIDIEQETPLIGLVQDRIPFNNPFLRDFQIDASISSTIRSRTPLSSDGGQGGSIKINTGDLSLRNGGNISTGSDRGQGGTLSIFASGDIEIYGSTKSGSATSFLTSATSASNDASALSIDAKNLILRDGGVIAVSTFSSGKGGDILISTSESVQISGIRRDGQFSSQINSGSFGVGDAGSLEIKTKNFVVKDGAEVSASAMNLGKGGSISLKADSVKILNTGKILTSSLGLGKAGNIEISAMKSVLIDGQDSGLFADTGGKAQGGNIFVNARDFINSNGGKLVTSTSGSQSAGNITLEVLNSITLDGRESGLFANTAIGSSGTGGSISIDPVIVSILNGAQISVNSEGIGPAGSIFLESGNLTLDRGTISASSKTNFGGNISLFVDNLLFLRNESKISTTAAGNGTGGNIDLYADLIVAFPTENSDITANAFQGEGGQINITTKRIFGIKDRIQLTEFSDITAVSENTELNGTVDINTPEVDPSNNLSEQPEVVEPSPKVTKGCRPGQAIGGSSFVHVGRGGLPSGPYEARTPNSVWHDLRTFNIQPQTLSAKTTPTSQTSASTPDIVEAKGWIKDSQGRIYLTTKVSQPSQNHLTTPAYC